MEFQKYMHVERLWSFGRYVTSYERNSDGAKSSIGVQKYIMRHYYGDYGYLTKTDHINGDTKDNRKCNLRLCDTGGNRANSKPTIKTSKFKGVRLLKSGKWESDQLTDNRVHGVQYRDWETQAVS